MAPPIPTKTDESMRRARNRQRLLMYRPELSLIPLGLAEDVPTARGRVFRITVAGRRKARSIAASWKRARAGEIT